MKDKEYMNMIFEQLEKNLVYTAYVNMDLLTERTKNKRLKFLLIPIKKELIDLINKKGNTNDYGEELELIKEDVEDILRRMN